MPLKELYKANKRQALIICKLAFYCSAIEWIDLTGFNRDDYTFAISILDQLPMNEFKTLVNSKKAVFKAYENLKE